MKERIITAIVMAAVFIPLLLIGSLPFLILVYILASIGLYELCKMKQISITSAPAIISFLLLWMLLIPDGGNGFFGTIDRKVQIFLLGLLCMLIVTVLSKNRFTFDHAGFLVISVLYVAMGFYFLFLTREQGIGNVLFVLFTIWATDSGAYFVGKSVGKRKLWPEISPNKTVEGFLGGIICALAVAAGFILFGNLSFSAGEMILLSIVVSIFGQLGDLVQSAYKRHYGVKDSGRLLPGHGGILDRLDSVIFILPILHLLTLMN
ncbi:phosphatidate cytidylyltransferase [Bacillus massiliglaciei]|uniref:phosphatidate cytidylyltransferase n=1 Tax=Bacillus massiliglaciei TaxID=1816693 RepID=UPI000B21A230|nr:phosphatidate cytidylyltransferase [Bacillus massiliglaciei]